MIKCRNLEHRAFSYGPGGYKCPCCGPNPKHRDKERKRLRKAFNRLIDKINKSDNEGSNRHDASLAALDF